MKKTIRTFSLIFISLITLHCTAGEKSNTSNSIPQTPVSMEGLETAYFASGCFWCTEAVFERVEGVKDVVSGYTGGEKVNPTYREVSAGRTNHAEAVRIMYDPSVVSYETLVDVFFGSHDPTTLNRQGPDRGRQYRSGIYYRNEDEKNIAVKMKNKWDESGKYNNPIVTEITAFSKFYDAEDYHQNYYEINPNQPYIASVSRPKVEKFIKHFPDKLKAKYKKK